MKLQTALTAATLFTIALTLSGPLHAGDPSPNSRPESFEKDRQSILAMAGNFKVVFRFEEPFALTADYTPKARYEEHAIEMVKVLQDSGDVIVLQHILMPEDSNRIVKHWKQTWRYEDRDVYSFKGNDTWKLEQISEGQAKGAWTQEVSQVDDSPRYEASAKWVHEHNLSFWQAPPTRRPLPRRDATTRKDYDVLMTVNRHTITPKGWIHEQDSYKQDSKTGTVLCREIGLNSYDRDDSADVTRAEKYWDETSENWAMISKKWDEAMARDGEVVLRSEVDGKRLYEVMFELAKKENATEGEADEIFGKFLVRGE